MTNRNTKHTPGPWSTFKDKDLEIWNQNTHVATVQGHHEFKDDVNNEANARLIAAAPELLDAVQSMFLFIETYGGDVTKNFAGTDNENLKHYKALIAKATGGAE